MAMTRDQQRALHAYKCVESVPETERNDYKTFVNALAPNVQRNGLAAAIAFLERDKNKRKAAMLFLDHLARASIPHLGSKGESFPARVRDLPLAEYMLATREVLKVAIWFRRAVQATFLSSTARNAGGNDHA